MSTRRSRLQIKPNIGGPKGLPGKSAPKAPGKTTGSGGKVKSDSTIKQSVKDCETTPSTLNDTKTTSARSPSPTKQNKLSNKTSNQDKSSVNEDIQANEPNKDNDSKTENHETDSIKEETKASVPSRARLRRFGKVNVAAASRSTPDNNKTDTAKSVEKSDSETKVTSDISKDADQIVDKENAETEGKVKEKETVSRRSRFPKAKPNVVDAGKRRQKQIDSSSTDDSKAISKSVEKPVIPSICVTDADNDTIETSDTKLEKGQDPGDKLETNSASNPSDPPMTQIQTKPPLPRSPIKSPVTPSLTSSPLKQGPGAEKRARTFSVTEAPVIKRIKKPKVEAPTDQPPDRSTMKMRDLIRWNPTNNKMKAKEKEDTAELIAGVENDPNVTVETKKEQHTPAAPDVVDDNDEDMAVPQVTIGPDGSIVINERSLVIDNKDKKTPADYNSIVDETDMVTTYASFRKKTRIKRWTKKETAKFYKVLGMLGIDFFLIGQVFPDRTRFELKQKFKREEKKNKVLIEKVLTEGLNFDPVLLDGPAPEGEDLASSEDEDEIQKKKQMKMEKNEKNKAAKREKKMVEKKAKRKRNSFNYYDEDSLSGDDAAHNTSSSTHKSKDGEVVKLYSSSHMSQKDGEVVNILMDMSQSQSPGNIPTVDGSPASNFLVARKIYLPGHPQASPIRQAGVQSIITMQASQLPHSPSQAASHSILKTMKLPTAISAKSLTGITHQINSPVNQPDIQNTTNSDSPCDSPQPGMLVENITRTLPQTNVGKQNQNSVPNITASENSVETSQIAVSRSALPFQFRDGLVGDITNNPGMQIMSPRSALETSTTLGLPTGDQNDQYVLVTVVPEGSDETVIHIYRINNGDVQPGETTAQVAGEPPVLNVPNEPGTVSEIQSIQSVSVNPDVENM